MLLGSGVKWNDNRDFQFCIDFRDELHLEILDYVICSSRSSEGKFIMAFL